MTSALEDSRLFRIDHVEGARVARGILIAGAASVAVWVAVVAGLVALFAF